MDIFKVLDKDGNGVLTKDEIYRGCKQLYSPEVAKTMVDKVFDNVDIDVGGTINYSEFVMAAID